MLPYQCVIILAFKHSNILLSYHAIMLLNCYNVKSSSQKEKYANRQKQVDIANATGKTHFGNATKVIG